FSSRRRHTRFSRDWSSDVCSSDLRAEDYARELRVLLGSEGSEICGLVDEVARSIAARESTADYVRRRGGAQGVSGYILHTVPARSEERRVGKECRCRWAPEQQRKK